MNTIKLSAEYMRAYVEANPDLVTCKTQLNGLKVLKYKNRVFYKNLWTPELVECRGTVVDDDYNIIQRPFTKIFNLHERGTKIDPDTIVTAPRKVNGFMGALTMYMGKPLVSTTGSLDSEFADMAYTMLSNAGAFRMAQDAGADITWIFEIVHPNDPHIVPEDIGVYLLGARRTTWNAAQHHYTEIQLDDAVQYYNNEMKRPDWYRMPFKYILDINRKIDHEGFVCFTDDGYELKLKSPQYLVKKFLARIRADKLMKVIEDTPHLLKERVDEEFYSLIDHVVDRKEDFILMSEQSRLGFVTEFIEAECSRV